MTKKDYIFLEEIVKQKGNCSLVYTKQDCKECLLRTETNPNCVMSIAEEEAVILLEGLSQEELFEILL